MHWGQQGQQLAGTSLTMCGTEWPAVCLTWQQVEWHSLVLGLPLVLLALLVMGSRPLHHPLTP